MTTPDEILHIVRQNLVGWKLAGVTSLPGEVRPIAPSSPDHSPPIQETPPDMARSRKSATAPPLPSVSANALPTEDSTPTEKSTLSREARAAKLQEISCQVAGCTRCHELATTRTQTVFGVGNPAARLVFLGEAPGADEDQQGEPFVGRAGQLMNKIIEAMKLRREDLYICNILRCRPPGNRNPSPEEANNCREWLDGQLRTVDPDYIVCWGTIAAQNLLNSTETISKLRGRFLTHGRAKVLCTYHPSYLLRNPSAKKPVWEDMQLLLREMGLPVPK